MKLEDNDHESLVMYLTKEQGNSFSDVILQTAENQGRAPGYSPIALPENGF
jgi:hypothetical protein